MDSVNIFISHKHEDAAAARGLKQILELYGGRTFRVFISEEIPPGSDWFQWIRQSLATSNLLLLLFTKPSSSWDWPLYEAGLFTSLEGNESRRVVCLHHPDREPPEPLKHLQAVPARPGAMIAFLQDLFGGTEITRISRAINVAFAQDEDRVRQAAATICAFFEPHDLIKRHYDRYIDLTIADPDQLSEESIPADAPVSSDLRTLEAFGLAGGLVRWRDIARMAAESGDDRWLHDLAHALCQARRGEIPQPVFTTFTSKRGDVILRPELFRTDQVSDGSLIFHILFIEEIAASLGSVPKEIRSLTAGLRFAFRFRWEILERYAHENLTVGDLEAVEAALARIETEAVSSGLLEGEAMESYFSGADAERVRQIYLDWATLRNPERTGELDRALDRGEAEEVGRILRSLMPLNREYVEMVARRFADAMAVAA